MKEVKTLFLSAIARSASIASTSVNDGGSDSLSFLDIAILLGTTSDINECISLYPRALSISSSCEDVGPI